jgi:hypothetical protein
MRPVLALALACAACSSPKVFTLRTQYTAALSVESATPSIGCELPAQQVYGKVQRVTEKGGKFSAVEWREAWAPLPVRILNRTDEVVTVDWERSAFVDATGLSYRVRVFQAGAAPGTPDAPAKPLERPSAPVIAPGARIDALVLPEPSAPGPAMFFLPPYAEERAPLRLVVSTAGSATRVAECVVTARLEQTKVERNADERWPGHGEACLPGLGCAEGLSCKGDVCVDPSSPPLPPGYKPAPEKKRLFGESCEKDDDCVQGFRCDRRLGMCVGG